MSHEHHHHHHGHDHECQEHDCGCGHHHGHSPHPWRAPILSAILLTVGIILNHTGAEWFHIPAVNLGWFIIAFLPVAIPVLREGWVAICYGDVFNEFTLMTIASVGAFFIREYPEAVGVMLFYTVGETLQHKAVERADGDIRKLLDVRPERTRVLRDGKFVGASPRDVNPGEEIEVLPGQRVPLDGVLTEGTVEFDTSALTGESVPRTLDAGDEVLAGMIAEGRTARVKATKPYDSSTLAKILEMVRDASSRKAPAEMFVRRFARVYTPIVILLAALIVVVPTIVGSLSHSFNFVFHIWLYRALVFLVISCPCALVISVPLGYFAGIGAASRNGILFKGGNRLDAMAEVDTVAFDKTGTLTTGRFGVTSTDAAIPLPELLRYMASAESRSTHPLARATVEYAETQDIVIPEPAEMQEIAGQGTAATVDGHVILVGNHRMMEANGVAIPDCLRNATSTMVICAVDGRYAGALIMEDMPKEDAPEAVIRLNSLGVTDLRLLSGDRPEVTAAMASRLKIPTACGGMLPQQKAEEIERLIAEGRRVAFVGDGMNDAPVLALSSVGVAMGGLGSDAAIESADVVIQDDRPSKLAIAVRIARTTRTIVRENIIGAIGIKVIVLTAGALGYATLWAAVFADVGVALLAVLNAMRILNKRY